MVKGGGSGGAVGLMEVLESVLLVKTGAVCRSRGLELERDCPVVDSRELGRVTGSQA
jgi:hypothetical protein